MTEPARTLPTRYGAVAMTLHWLIAAAIIANVTIAFLAEDLPRPERIAYMSFHMALGLTVLVLSIARVAWRWMNPVPPPPAGLSRLERVAGTALHHLFYLLIVAIPLAGWLMVSANNFTPSYFGLFAWPAFPGFAGLDKVAAHGWHEVFESAHVFLAWAMIVLVPVHIAAGLYHHVIRKDNVLLRMLPGTRLRSDV